MSYKEIFNFTDNQGTKESKYFLVKNLFASQISEYLNLTENAILGSS